MTVVLRFSDFRIIDSAIVGIPTIQSLSLTGVLLSVVFFLLSRPEPPQIAGEQPNDDVAVLQKKVLQLVWRIYFTNSGTEEWQHPPVPADESLYLLAFIPFDELYREAYWDERMHVRLTARPDSGSLKAELVHDGVKAPFRKYHERIPCVAQEPSFGHYLAVYWELDPATSLADLEKLRFRFSADEKWHDVVSCVVVMADDVPIAVIDRDGFGERQSLDLALSKLNIDPYTGEIDH